MILCMAECFSWGCRTWIYASEGGSEEFDIWALSQDCMGCTAMQALFVKMAMSVHRVHSRVEKRIHLQMARFRKMVDICGFPIVR